MVLLKVAGEIRDTLASACRTALNQFEASLPSSMETATMGMTTKGMHLIM
jgi:hypothetical protein